MSNENSDRYLQFRISEELYAIPLSEVREVISVPEMTPIPKAPGYFSGIMNLRGQIVSIIDLRKKLGVEQCDENKEQAVVILDFSNCQIGMIVDAINQVLKIDKSLIREAPAGNEMSNAKYINGIFEYRNSLVLLMNISQALDLNDIEIINSSESA